jgi:hypothetical protein
MLQRPDGKRWGKAHAQRPLAHACRAAHISPAASFHVLRTYLCFPLGNGGRAIAGGGGQPWPCRHPNDREALRASRAELRRASDPGDDAEARPHRADKYRGSRAGACEVMRKKRANAPMPEVTAAVAVLREFGGCHPAGRCPADSNRAGVRAMKATAVSARGRASASRRSSVPIRVG